MLPSLSRLSLTYREGAQKRWNSILEWVLGLAVPLLVAGPLCESHYDH